MITNASAGGSEADAVEGALDVLRSERTLQVEATEDLEALGRVFDERAAAPEGCDTVVVVGGDGSLHAVIAALHEREELGDVTLALVPLGTGNDFARSVGLSLDPAEAAREVLTGESRQVDLIVDDSGNVTVNAVHLGLGAEAGIAAETWKRRLGPLGYVIGAAISGFTKPGVDVAVTIDGERVRPRGRVLQVAIGNGQYVGGGTRLLPEADPTDGELDVSVSYANPLMRRLGYVVSMRFGLQAKRDDVVYVRGTRVGVSGEEFRCNSDGEIGDPVRRRSWHLEPGVITMVLPPRVAADPAAAGAAGEDAPADVAQAAKDAAETSALLRPFRRRSRAAADAKATRMSR